MSDTYLQGAHNSVGDDFQTTQTPDTGTIVLLSGVPLDMTQKNQLWFSSKTEQHDYFISHYDNVVVSDVTYQKKQNNMRVPINAELLTKYNYVMYQNKMYGNKWFYAFILDVEYRAPETSWVTFKLDAFQTYFLDVKYHNSYVKAMHQQEWRDSDGGTGYRVPVERNQDEGLNYGKEYDIVKQIQLTPETNPNIKWLVITSSEQFEKADFQNDGTTPASGTAIGGLAVPYVMYVLPVDLNADINVSQHITLTNGRGQDFYGGDNSDAENQEIPHTLSSLHGLQYAIKKYDKFAGKIISINVMDAPPFPVTGKYPTYQTAEKDIVPVGMKVTSVKNKNTGKTTNLYLTMIRVYGTYGRLNMRYDLGNVYKYFRYNSEYSKMMNSPYCAVEITDFKGHTMTIKPEYLNTSKLVIDMYTSLSWETKIGYSIKNYNIGVEPYGGNEGQYNGEINWLNTIYDNISGDVPILTDQSAIFMQSHRNALSTEKTNLQETNRTRQAINTATSLMKGGAGAIGAGIQGGIVGGPAGALISAGTSIANSAVNYASSTYANHLRSQTSERNLANAQNAKLEDISNMPPQISGQGNNTLFETENEIGGVYVIFKQIKPEYRKKIRDYFHMYGYLCNELIDMSNKAPMTSRKFWNYIETQHVLITGGAPVPMLDELSAVFDKGVTLWHVNNGIEVGDYSKTNSEV